MMEDTVLESIDTPPPDGSFVERLADRLGLNANVAAVYGEPVERDSVTIIPVAEVRYGFGGGSGRDPKGGGGGGGVRIDPVGYIELRNGSSEYRTIKDTAANARVLLAAVLLSPFLLGGLVKLLRH